MFVFQQAMREKDEWGHHRQKPPTEQDKKTIKALKIITAKPETKVDAARSIIMEGGDLGKAGRLFGDALKACGGDRKKEAEIRTRIRNACLEEAERLFLDSESSIGFVDGDKGRYPLGKVAWLFDMALEACGSDKKSEEETGGKIGAIIAPYLGKSRALSSTSRDFHVMSAMLRKYSPQTTGKVIASYEKMLDGMAQEQETEQPKGKHATFGMFGADVAEELLNMAVKYGALTVREAKEIIDPFLPDYNKEPAKKIGK